MSSTTPGAGRIIVGQIEVAEIAPGQKHADRLFFPGSATPDVGGLRLELDAQRVGGTGTVRLLIISSLIDTRRQKAPDQSAKVPGPKQPLTPDTPTPVSVPRGWLDNSTPARLGDMEVRIKAVDIGP